MKLKQLTEQTQVPHILCGEVGKTKQQRLRRMLTKARKERRRGV